MALVEHQPTRLIEARAARSRPDRAREEDAISTALSTVLSAAISAAISAISTAISAISAAISAT